MSRLARARKLKTVFEIDSQFCLKYRARSSGFYLCLRHTWLGLAFLKSNTILVNFEHRELTGDLHTIRMNISICTFAAEVTFLAGIKQTSHPIGCAFVAALLQYSLLAIFTWSILEAVQLYKMLMDMFDEESRWKVYYIAGYGNNHIRASPFGVIRQECHVVKTSRSSWWPLHLFSDSIQYARFVWYLWLHALLQVVSLSGIPD